MLYFGEREMFSVAGAPNAWREVKVAKPGKGSWHQKVEGLLSPLEQLEPFL